MKKKDMRVLTPKELYNAMGFPLDYIIDQSYRRKEIRMNICLTEMRLKEGAVV